MQQENKKQKEKWESEIVLRTNQINYDTKVLKALQEDLKNVSNNETLNILNEQIHILKYSITSNAGRKYDVQSYLYDLNKVSPEFT